MQLRGSNRQSDPLNLIRVMPAEGDLMRAFQKHLFILPLFLLIAINAKSSCLEVHLLEYLKSDRISDTRLQQATIDCLEEIYDGRNAGVLVGKTKYDWLLDLEGKAIALFVTSLEKSTPPGVSCRQISTRHGDTPSCTSKNWRCGINHYFGSASCGGLSKAVNSKDD